MASSDHDPGYPVKAALDRAVETSSHSWEYGTTAQALLEHHSPGLSTFSSNPFPSGKLPSISQPQTIPSLAYASKHISTTGTTLSPADKIGVADPCNLGVYALLLGQSDPRYLDAARRQIDYVLHTAPRLTNGAISHRTDVSEAWADFVYMLPPFLAYAAIAFGDVGLLREAIKQCKLYRELLMDNDEHSTSRGLWRHIEGDMNEDKGFWSTSCGWAAAGMARVLAVLAHLPADLSLALAEGEGRESGQNLTSWIREILDGAMRTDDGGDGTGLLRNYLADRSYFAETAGTALLASVVYRMTALAPIIFHTSSEYVRWAEEKRKAVAKCVDLETGIPWPTCQSTDHRRWTPLEKGEVNPEGQCFLVMLGAAWRDWWEDSRC